MDVTARQPRINQAPAVRVTIGRIEIRAVMPPAPPLPAQRQRRQPALTLDQYLKQRNEAKP